MLPLGPATRTAVPMGRDRRLSLNAVGRVRVAIMKESRWPGELAKEKVRVITPFVGGGFGGKSGGGLQAIEAAKLAKTTGKPVQVCWSRAEEFFLDSFRPAAVVKIRSGIDGEGRICLWD